MRVLRYGMSGDDVVTWQSFLRGSINTDLLISGTFDVATVAETKRFQGSCNLYPVDGIVGTDTYAAAISRGLNVVTDDPSFEDGPGWPARPDFGQMSYAQREDVFGRFSYVPAKIPSNPEAIKILGSWVADNIVNVQFPQPIPAAGDDVVSSVFHKRIADQVKGLFDAWFEAGLWSQILTWDGSWAPRFIRGSDTVLSNHAWATAFDVNCRWNQLGHTPVLKGKPGSVRELVKIANDHGMFWGGHFVTLSGNLKRIDGMHFEIAHLV